MNRWFRSGASLLAAGWLIGIPLFGCGSEGDRKAAVTSTATSSPATTPTPTPTVPECPDFLPKGRNGDCMAGDALIHAVGRGKYAELEGVSVRLKERPYFREELDADSGLERTEDVFVVVTVTVENTGDAPLVLGPDYALFVGGQTFSQADVSLDDGIDGFEIQPGLDKSGTLVFEVPGPVSGRVFAQGACTGLLVGAELASLTNSDSLNELGEAGFLRFGKAIGGDATGDKDLSCG